MEKWKIAVIGALLISLFGFGLVQQNADKKRLTDPPPAPLATPIPSPYLGKNLPAWNFKTWNSKPVPFSSLKGKPAFVEIFRIECSHCEDAAPFLVALEKRYAPRGLKMVSIQSPGNFIDAANPENSWPAVLSWLKARKVTTPVAFDKGSEYFQGTIKKQVLGGDDLLYPAMIWIDKNGVIDFAQTGHDTAKAITLAVEFEKRFPTSNSPQKNAADLVKWLTQNLNELRGEPALFKALGDDIAKRLQP